MYMALSIAGRFAATFTYVSLVSNFVTTPRVEKFWTNEETNYFINKYEEVGLVDVTNQPLQYGDILFIQTDGSGNPNHAAIYVGTEKILHHCEGRLSRYDAYVYGSYWLKHTVKQMRHKSKC
ncbi:C40 family peptidase (plasmid) [Acinetobacter baumannii]|nr:NlpC/P60 family protein [Acinetobacter baumannii]UQM35201.1 C40 family peptidase [Acinetobacter baumannii]